MAPRALRKLQQQQELEKQLAAARDGGNAVTESEEEDEDVPLPIAKKPFNAFDMLEDAEEEESELEEDIEGSTAQSTPPPTESKPSQSSKSKKKKKKAKKKTKEKSEDHATKDDSGDEIDRALREIAAKNAGQIEEDRPLFSHEAQATKLLSIDQKNLNPTNEMRSLFGNIALEGESRSAARTPPRRREQNQQGGVDLGTALTGRYSAASRGKELGTLATRRNVFMQGKSEWPLATSGGLSMEHQADPATFERKFDIVHNGMYQETQRKFRMAVESMDPQNMISLLMMVPYHIATLLQVSEIAKHQGDHSVSGDLLERALFSLGRSVHSSFPSALREGTARIPFEKPANRELYLAIWRYIRNLEMRGTWRTAFEWAKILFQLNTRSDPYGMTLMLDQLALRGRQHGQLIDLASTEGYGDMWNHLPNIHISLVLAFQRSQQPKEARRQLAIVIHKYPYILSALASGLDITPLPKALWGKLPTTDGEKLYTELYVSRTKDLWNTPESSALLVEVAETLDLYKNAINAAPATPKLEISLEEARHIMLLEIPSLIALLPRQFRNMATSSSDVLPPPDSLSDFTARAPADTSGPSAMQALFNAAGVAGAPAAGAGGLFQRLMTWFNSAGSHAQNGEGEAAFNQLREQLGPDVPAELIEQMLAMHLHEADGHDPGSPRITAADLNMAGGWDYYEDAANAPSDEDSMPELESASDADQQPRNPHAAMVEEADDEDEAAAAPRHAPTTSGPVLRHADSEDGESAPHPPPTHTLYAPTQPANPAVPAPSEDAIESDPQRLQRWLLAAGLSEVQEKPETMARYAGRLKMLRKTQQDWIVSMVRQRAGGDVADRIARAL